MSEARTPAESLALAILKPTFHDSVVDPFDHLDQDALAASIAAAQVEIGKRAALLAACEAAESKVKFALDAWGSYEAFDAVTEIGDTLRAAIQLAKGETQ